ncbi:hypothetical protein C6501_04960 [Candidatus Poribacteria bacterium]|nr:MAG: hypothetical protein C6501_04960 [Candidatus Poribacteria bacterium]
MRVFYIISATIIVVGIAFIFYVQYDAKIFRESLPKMPEEVSEDTGKDVQPQTKTERGLTVQTEPTDIQHDNIENETSQAADVPKDENDPGKKNINSTQEDTVVNNPQTVEIPKKKLRYSELQIEQKIVMLRDWLVENHDDHGEIEEFLALEKERHESTVYFSDNIVVLYMPIEMQIRRAELLVKLYPGYGNESVLQSLREEKARYDSGEAIPSYSYPLEHWEKKAAQRR